MVSNKADEDLWNEERLVTLLKEVNDVYAGFGQTFGGRYLSVFFVYKPETKTAIIISARDMSKKERKTYGRK